MKFDLNKISEAAARVLKPADVTQLMEMLRDMAPDEKEEKLPAVKKQFVVLVSDPQSAIPADYEFSCWVLQMPEGESVLSIEDRVIEAAYSFNASKAGRARPVQTIGEAIESVKAGQFKERDVWVKTRTPVLVVRTNNEIPQTPGLFGDGERGTFTKGQS